MGKISRCFLIIRKQNRTRTETESYQNKEQYKKESYPRFFNPPVNYIENKKKVGNNRKIKGETIVNNKVKNKPTSW